MIKQIFIIKIVMTLNYIFKGELRLIKFISNTWSYRVASQCFLLIFQKVSTLENLSTVYVYIFYEVKLPRKWDTFTISQFYS